MAEEVIGLPEALDRRARRPHGLVLFYKRIRRVRLGGLGALIILGVILAALLANVIAPYDPIKTDLSSSLKAPSAAHIFGTDELGRDVYSRILFGARISIQAGVISVGLAVVAGVIVGLTAGYRGGMIDGALMALMDSLLAFPVLVLALAITAVLGPSLQNAVLALGITYMPFFARLVRAQTLSIRERDYVMAARVLGADGFRIARLHIFPNVTGPIIIQGSLNVAFAVIAEASLSFLGLGVPPPEPSWGSMLKFGYPLMDRAPWLAVVPGVAIMLTVLGFNFLGDAIRDALDPRMRRRGE